MNYCVNFIFMFGLSQQGPNFDGIIRKKPGINVNVKANIVSRSS